MGFLPAGPITGFRVGKTGGFVTGLFKTVTILDTNVLTRFYCISSSLYLYKVDKLKYTKNHIVLLILILTKQ